LGAQHAAGGAQLGEKPPHHPGRKMVVLFSGGFPLTQENQSELTATIDTCNKSNVASTRWMHAVWCDSSGRERQQENAGWKTHAVSNHVPARKPRPRILLAAYPAMAMPDPQRPGGGGGGGAGVVAEVAPVVQVVAAQAAVVVVAAVERAEAAQGWW